MKTKKNWFLKGLSEVKSSLDINLHLHPAVTTFTTSNTLQQSNLAEEIKVQFQKGIFQAFDGLQLMGMN